MHPDKLSERLAKSSLDISSASECFDSVFMELVNDHEIRNNSKGSSTQMKNSESEIQNGNAETKIDAVSTNPEAADALIFLSAYLHRVAQLQLASASFIQSQNPKDTRGLLHLINESFTAIKDISEVLVNITENVFI